MVREDGSFIASRSWFALCVEDALRGGSDGVTSAHPVEDESGPLLFGRVNPVCLRGSLG